MTDSVETNKTLKVLRIDASGRKTGSTTRTLTDELIEKLAQDHSNAELKVRDLTQGVPFVDEAWIMANFTAPEERNSEQQATLAYSDALVEEVKQSDVLVIGTPIYNFGVPAALKAWIDQVCRARLTFRYTPDGPVGLLENKKAIIVIASGGTKVGSEIDFASSYLKHVLGFIGIHDVSFVAADRQGAGAEEALSKARGETEQLRVA